MAYATVPGGGAVLPDDKRQAILDAAIHSFARKGYHATRISDIADRAGIGKGTVYLYFESKADVLISILQTFVDEVLSFADELMRESVTAREGIERFFRHGFARIAENPDLLTVLGQRLFLSDPAMQRRGEEFFRSIILRIVSKIAAVMDAGQVRTYDPTIIACAVIGAINTFELYHVLHPDEDPAESIPRITSELTRFFIEALVPDPSG